MNVPECVSAIVGIAEDADGSSMPAIYAQIDRFNHEMRSVDGSGGKDEMLNLSEALQGAARKSAPTAASELLESAAACAGDLWSNWG
jgi:hypothetical protein